MFDSIDFIKKLYFYEINHVAIENPMGLLSTYFRKPDQTIQPYQFGNEASKKTCLWLKNLPLLNIYKKNKVGKGEFVEWEGEDGNLKSQPKWYFDALKAKTPEERRTLRSKSFNGISEAMAVQWSDFVIRNKGEKTTLF